MKSLKLLGDLISGFDPTNPNFRPTELFNEGWLIKLILHQASGHPDSKFPIGFLPESTWYSEGLLPTAFKPRNRGDKLGESRTNADGVIGHIEIGRLRKADLELSCGATQFTVVEAKINSPLSSGTKNANYFDQAARSVACMSEVLARSEVNLIDIIRLDFVLLAPDYAIKRGKFTDNMTRSSIKKKVERRVSEYGGYRDQWFEEYFSPLIKSVNLQLISWEETIKWLGRSSPNTIDDLNGFYKQCLNFA